MNGKGPSKKLHRYSC
jgi:hypothetical protein